MPADPLAAARELLPWHAVWGSTLLYFAVGFLLLVGVFWGAFGIATLCAERAGEEWPSRARRRFERRASVLASMLFPALALGWSFPLFRGPLVPIGTGAGFTIAALLFSPVLFLAAWRVRREAFGPAAKVGEFADDCVLGFVFLLPVLLWLVIALLPRRDGPLATWILPAAWSALWIYSGGFGGFLRGARLMRLAGRAGPELATRAQRCAERVGIELRGTWVLHSGSRTRSRSRSVARWWSRTARSGSWKRRSSTPCSTTSSGTWRSRAGGRRSGCRSCSWPLSSSSRHLTSVVPSRRSSWSCSSCSSCCSPGSWCRPSREADQAAQSASAGPALARALEKLHRATLSPAVRRRAWTHPHLPDRMQALGVEPTFERPEPPSPVPALAGAFVSFVLCAALSGGAFFFRSYVHAVDSGTPETVLRHLSTYGGTTWHLAQLGSHWVEEGRIAEALVLLRAAQALEPAEPTHRTREAWALLRDERPEEAAHALRRSEELFATLPEDDPTVEYVSELRVSIEEWRVYLRARE